MNAFSHKDKQRIVVGIDFSDAAHTALAHAELLAEKLGVGLDLVHVCDPSTFKPALPYQKLPDLEEWLHQRYSEVQHRGKRHLATLAMRRAAVGASQMNAVVEPGNDAALVLADTTVDRSHFLEGRPARRLSAFCQDNGALMLVIGAHGRHGHGGLGGTARYLLRHCSCPVMIARDATGVSTP